MDYYAEITMLLGERPMTLYEIAKRLSPSGADHRDIVRTAAKIEFRLGRYRKGGYIRAERVRMADCLGHVRDLFVYSLPEDFAGAV